jgi:hypothetical protein
MRIDDPFEVRRKPAADLTVCALNSPMQIGQVFVVGHYRYIITEEISKDEFERLLAENEKYSAGVAGNATIQGSAARKESFQSGHSPNFDAKCFYRARVEFARPE